MRFSKVAFLLCGALLLAAQFLYYPKWKLGGTEATISWDVSGYYFYLPATFIYQDLDEVKFRDSIMRKYRPASSAYQAFDLPNGNRVMKYSMGQAISYLPAFVAGHAIASLTSYSADGFSRPYQLALAIWSILVALLGLWVLRIVLLRYFTDIATGIALLVIVFATNYLNYAGIDAAMTHNYLFTIYALLMWATVRFYESPRYLYALIIGALVGLAGLTRPTDIIAMIIPVAWGVWNGQDLKNRWHFFQKHWKHLLVAVIVCGLIGSLQLIYWKYVTGSFIYYSYEDQGFSWLHPHLWPGIFGYQSGWLVYSPSLVFALVGFLVLLIQRRKIAWPTGIFAALAIYITFAWDEYLYGGSLGIRAMVQYYAVLALPLAAFTEWLWKKGWPKWAFVIILLAFTYYNIWLTHQAHKGGFLPVGQITKAFFWETVGKWNLERDVYKLLDHHERYSGEMAQVDTIQKFSLNNPPDSIKTCAAGLPRAFENSICLHDKHQMSREFRTSVSAENGPWLRVQSEVYLLEKEWNRWAMTQFIVKYLDDEEEIKTAMIKIDRLLGHEQSGPIWMDSRIPKAADEVKIYYWNANSAKRIAIKPPQAIQFNEP